MNISELSLKRPVLATVMNIAIVIFGLVGFSFLALREYPAIDPPIVNVMTTYTGANSEVIQSQITEPLEKSINGIPGIRTINSSSSVGSSNITVEFNLGVNLETATNDVRDKVSQALRNLPQDIDAPPIVSKADANADFILMMTLRSKTKSALELTEYAENVLQQRFQTIDEVSNVGVRGKRFSMRIFPNPDLLNAYAIAFNDIQTALNKENIELPAGKIYGQKAEFIIRTLGRLTTEADFRNIILKQDATGIVRLGDVAKVELGPEQEDQGVYFNGVQAVMISLSPQPGANYIKIADEFYKRLEEVKKSNKSDIEFAVPIDNTKSVRRALQEVKETIFISFALVVLVIFFFFRNWLIAIRPLIDIPISLIATFFIMYIAGFSVNVLTLLAIVLATGLVVDDGIVVTENIFRKLEEGLPLKEAAREGSKEIFFAVISTSITLAVVFMPVIFLQGFVGSLFKEFGVVVASAVLVSAFVSLTITPVLNVYLNRKDGKQGKFYERTEPFFKGLEAGYKNLLTKFISVRWMAWVIIVACIGLIFIIGKNIQTELAPLEDKGMVRVTLSAQEGTSYEDMKGNLLKNIRMMQDSIPEQAFTWGSVPGYGGNSGNSSASGRIGFVPIENRTRTQSEIVTDLNKRFKKFKDVRIFSIEEQTISVGMMSRGSLPVQFIIENLDFAKIQSVIPKFLEAARKDKTFQNVDVNLKFNKPEFDLNIDRMRVRDLGLTTYDVSQALQAAFSGARSAYFIMNDRQYQVITQVVRGDRTTPTDINKIYIRNNKGLSIPISSVLNVVENSNPPNLYHYNRFNAATISASLAEGKTIGDGVNAMNKIAKDLLDESFQTALSGPSRDFAESSSNIAYALLLALILIYLVLAAQFESFKDPFIIMLTVPLAIAGALLCLWLFGQTLNIFSEIGIIMLIGLVTKNGILIVEFANKKRATGLSLKAAVLDAAAQRFRPILMTSLATALGALPIAISIGAAATSRKPLGTVVVGGLIFSLILTLFVIPAVYTYLSGKKDHVEKE
jgi:HAE1 family hydrophobic/amphiphilic exporter-1/multidrug efflux pump